MIPGMYEGVSAAKHAARHSSTQHRTVPHRTAGHGTARRGVAEVALRCAPELS